MPQERDWWDKSEIIAKIASAVVLPFALVLINNTISTTAASREKAESQANRLPVFIDFLSSDSPKKRVLAEKVVRYLGTTNQIPGDVIPLLIEIDRSQTANEAKAPDSARAALQALATANPDLKKTISKSLTTDLFIQIADSSQLGMAQQVKTALREEGFRVPDIEDVGESKSPSGPVEIRFFEDDTKGQAESVARLLSQMGIQSSLKLESGYGKLKHLEVWFPRGKLKVTNE